MTLNRIPHGRNAFTLIELMVVVAIIGLLISVLLPSFTAVRTRARVTQTTGQFGAIDTGISLYRGETGLGGSLPPSASDHPTDRQLISNPQSITVDTTGVRISGAHLLVHALIGADGLGTPGFKDFGTGAGTNPRDGLWWNDTHGTDTEPYGAYALNKTDGKERHTRFGAGAYVDDKMKQAAKSLNRLVDDGSIINLDCGNLTPGIACDQLLFLDPWNHPILYYKANPSVFLMVADVAKDVAGIYRQEDNGIITGTVNGDNAATGVDFGSGPNSGGHLHDITDAIAPKATDTITLIQTDAAFDDSFARFILDPSILVRPTPVNKPKGYLLISAGPDGRYGSDDDITNWTRRAQ